LTDALKAIPTPNSASVPSGAVYAPFGIYITLTKKGNYSCYYDEF